MRGGRRRLGRRRAAIARHAGAPLCPKQLARLEPAPASPVPPAVRDLVVLVIGSRPVRSRHTAELTADDESQGGEVNVEGSDAGSAGPGGGWDWFALGPVGHCREQPYVSRLLVVRFGFRPRLRPAVRGDRGSAGQSDGFAV